MADIFLSYARADRERAQQIAKALEARGWTVWWDATIKPGERFRAAIAEHLRSARCVVVLWSAKSIESDWVIDEAEDGKQRRILIQALIEDIQPPHGFRQIQAANLRGWSGSDSDEFVRFCEGVSDHAPLLGSPQATGDLHLSTLLPGDRYRVENWIRLQQAFGDLARQSPTTSVSVLPGPEGSIRWSLGRSSRESWSAFSSLAQEAGKNLLESTVWRPPRSEPPSFLDSEPLRSWLLFLNWTRNKKQFDKITNPAKASAEACAFCTTQEAEFLRPRTKPSAERRVQSGAPAPRSRRRKARKAKRFS